MKPNQIKFDGGVIVIQSCDSKVANIGIFPSHYQAKSAYHHVSVPDFVREWGLPRFTNMSFHEYDQIIANNKAEILQVIQKLNDC